MREVFSSLPKEYAHSRTTGVCMCSTGSNIFPFKFSLTAVTLRTQHGPTHKAQCWGSAFVTTWFRTPFFREKKKKRKRNPLHVWTPDSKKIQNFWTFIQLTAEITISLFHWNTGQFGWKMLCAFYDSIHNSLRLSG